MSDIDAGRFLQQLARGGGVDRALESQAGSALDHAGIRWETTVTACGFAAIEACVRAGLAVSVMVDRLSPPDLSRLRGLPRLPFIDVFMQSHPKADAIAVQAIADALKAALKKP